MAKAWLVDVRKAKKLTLWASDDFRSSASWGSKFLADTIVEFNRIVATHDIDFVYEESTAQPPREGTKGTNVQLGVSSGTHTYYQFGKNEGKLPPGSTLNAKTHIDREIKGAVADALVAKAAIFVHTTPVVTEAARPAGSGLKRYVLMHEMLHAMGLEDDDPGHKSGGSPDVFRTFVGIQAGGQPEDADGHPGDRIKVGPKLFMPKFFLSSSTAKLLKSIWK